MNRNTNPTIPPNFVSLRMLKELKEKRDEEEKLKREEEERVRKLKEEEEQERIRKLKEEEEESLKNRLKPLGSKNPYGGSFRRDARPKARPFAAVRSTPDGGANGEAKAGHDGRLKPPRCANPEAHMSGNGRSDPEERSTATDGGSDSKTSSLDESKTKKKKKTASGRRKKEASKGREGEMTKVPLGPNGLTAPMIEMESEITKVTADVNGSGINKVSSGERCRPVKVIGSESCPIAEVSKGFSDLKMGGGNPNPNRRGRGRGYGGRSWGGGRRPDFFGRGGGDGGMVWVKKTTES